MSHKVYIRKEDPVGSKCCIKKKNWTLMMYLNCKLLVVVAQGSYHKVKFSFIKQLTNTVKLGQLCWNSTAPVHVIILTVRASGLCTDN